MRNNNIGKTLKVENITERCRKARLRWFGHVKRRDQEYVGRKTLEMVPPGRRKKGRVKQRWMDCVNRDMRAIRTTKDEVHDRTGGRRIVSPQRPHNQVGEARRKRQLMLGNSAHILSLVGLPGFARDSCRIILIITISALYFYFLFFFSGDHGIPLTFDKILTLIKPKQLRLLNPASKCSPWCLMGPICSTSVHSQIHLHYMCKMYSRLAVWQLSQT